MDTLLTMLLVFLFPILLLGRLLNALLRRDPLRLREPVGQTCWVARESEATPAEYFSEGSVAEGRGHGGLGRLARPPLILLARLHTPRRCVPGETSLPATSREEGIPDEIYTLW
jgi:hypothetical protein